MDKEDLYRANSGIPFQRTEYQGVVRYETQKINVYALVFLNHIAIFLYRMSALKTILYLSWKMMSSFFYCQGKGETYASH